MNPLYIIDVSNWNYKFKAVHTSHSFVEYNGVHINTSQLFGWLKALSSLPFDHIALAVDGLPSQSLSLLPTYKGTRNKESDEGLSVSKTEVLQFITSLGPLLHKDIVTFCSPGFEADQVISSCVHLITNQLPKRWTLRSRLNTLSLDSDPVLSRFSPTLSAVSPDYFSQFDSVVIATTDSDMSQLLRFPGVYIDTSLSGTRISDSRLCETTSFLPPTAIPIYKTIIGDVSDNVPSLQVDVLAVKPVLAHITSNEILTEFLSHVRTLQSSLSDPDLIKLAQEIHDTQLSAFERNFAITFLDFYTIPQAISFPSYDPSRTFTRYRLRKPSL